MVQFGLPIYCRRNLINGKVQVIYLEPGTAFSSSSSLHFWGTVARRALIYGPEMSQGSRAKPSLSPSLRPGPVWAVTDVSGGGLPGYAWVNIWRRCAQVSIKLKSDHRKVLQRLQWQIGPCYGTVWFSTWANNTRSNVFFRCILGFMRTCQKVTAARKKIAALANRYENEFMDRA